MDPLLDNCAQFSGTYNGTYSETACDGAQYNGTIDNFVVDESPGPVNILKRRRTAPIAMKKVGTACWISGKVNYQNRSNAAVL